jgi:hypothetical protein
VRYYGYTSNISRRNIKREEPEREMTVNWKMEVIEVAFPPISKELKNR